ncbi:MAG: 1,4-dihydroxy-2-naphthoate polyprenyltransferase [Calditrichaeota bacterium]|nr:1,4-dihydroxy-2-naphthoate polyprenyltransferase [Calditrichota bacterium]MCB9369104.1 1,4-dihydroxy-2-naphthoate polyprenyltransferase [Calditrichota bacterium]
MSALSAWILASRPKTLVAALLPVIIGCAYAYSKSGFDWFTATLILLSATCIQIGTNLANDYSDYKKGADTHERLGPTRVTQAGLLRPKVVLAGTIVSFALAVLLAVPLIVRGGWPILAIGATGILFGWMYTGGPYPLGYNGLAEFFVLLYFGVLAVAGTVYLFILEWPNDALVLGLIPGILACGLLAVNNVRDEHTDRKAGKRTPVVRFGREFGKVEFALSVFLPYLIVAWMSLPLWSKLLPMFAIVLAFGPVQVVWNKTDGPSLNRALAGTARHMLVFGVLLSIGLVL